MKDKKSQYYVQAILKILLSSDMVTTVQLGEEVGLSEKTVRTKVEAINDYLRANQLGEICKKRRIGIWLNATDEQKIEIRKRIFNNQKIEHLQSDHSRMYTALRHILKISKHNRLTTNQLADIMYLSVPTAFKVLSDCKDWLKLFNVDLNVVRNKGFELICTESQYRIAVKHFILRFTHQESLDEIISYFTPSLDLRKVKKCIIDTESEWGFEFAEESFNEIYVYLALSIYRRQIDSSQEILLSDEELRMLQTYNEYSFAEAILKKVVEKFSVPITQAEIGFISIPILCSKMIDPGYNVATEDIIREYDNRLKEFVKKIISVVSEVLNVDMTNDEMLFHGLMIHMKPAIFRLRYEKNQSNGLKGYIKSEFKQAFRVSWLISVLFEEHFQLMINEDELSYITLYIQSALERNKKPMNTVLVTRTSMGVNQMLCEKIKRTFPIIEDIKVVSAHDFRLENYPSVDMIISTRSVAERDIRIVEIDEILSESSVSKINHKIRQLSAQTVQSKIQFDPVCHTLFEPDLIFTHIEVENKQQLLEMMCSRLLKKGYVTKKYQETVLLRELATPTSIGNMVAIPHGEQTEINEAKIVIATLQKPILWDTDMVDVVFLLAVKMTNDYEIRRTQLFYKQYIHLVNTDKDVNVLRSFESNTDMYRHLIS
ncbi:MAG: PTS sugar transporter subunit IIA [Erysipelotrichaceae bacterium]|nr:PTS sugar transporter subunit IIA [Erysipelotrichaceae bacterium]